ncbi:MAG: SDR family oxidoreductase [Leptospiraceae bacterium]|nr:SDR family oxidoreductase [Leptospiraceae bacterium]MDW8306704.1 SDR family NAD(P)-dependent oxidoreductase [Leptospiraceae bacterium]
MDSLSQHLPFRQFLKDQVVLITGTSRGIGRALARGFQDAGALVYGTVRREDQFPELTQEGIHPLLCDVRFRDQLEKVFETIYEKHPIIHTVVNNAGIATHSPASLLKESEINDLIDTNLKAVFHVCQIYYQKQRNKGGNIINMASVLGLIATPLAAVYCATKGGVIQLTKALALEWAKNHFRVNALAPGFIDTDMTEVMKKRPQVIQQVLQNIPLGRLGESKDVVGVALFLASEAASYVTGQVFVVDGGLSAH